MATGKISPPSERTNVDLVSSTDSKIINVDLYQGRAEITRLCRFTIQTGQNDVVITGLPNVLDRDSIRVEGRGTATIHDIKISDSPTPNVASTSPRLEDLLLEKELAEKALQLCKKRNQSLETYLDTLNVKDTDVSGLDKIMEHYDLVAEKIDTKTLELERRIKGLDPDIEKERAEIAATGAPYKAKLRVQMTINVFAPSAEPVEIIVIYAVQAGSWDAAYDIRVNMQDTDKPVTLIYKAVISQSTGEDWNGVPLTLETASPTLGVDIPHLSPWTLSVCPPVRRLAKGGFLMPSLPNFSLLPSRSGGQSSEMSHRNMVVTSRGDVNASVTIVELELDAVMSWIVVPKRDHKCHLKAGIINASDYTFLEGQAHVYINGSFIAKSNRVINGFYGNTVTHSFDQRITVSNTKPHAVTNLKVVDRFPTSDTSQITVKGISLELSIVPEQDRLKSVNAAADLPPAPIQVAEGVLAQWDGADEPGCDVEALGLNGKINWLCAVPAHSKINLLLSFEVTAPRKTNIQF
ncbi:hypothetical protein DXG03_005433 [Asterophora parasitica]|uniref:Mucoidy inhibitor A n=1 Tax=Asterophora parasitica TaxID=117018 RepID=A0A9P7G7Y0_9AGAR|nr:hypothetical protein DXG03_005433 [Asterophora parasitica]